MQDDADGWLNTSWTGSYYANTTLSGTPALVRTDPAINFDWGTGSPSVLIPNDGFSVRWTASPNFVWGGNFNFTTTTDDGVRLYIDNVLTIDGWSGGLNTRTATTALTAGIHSVRMDYYEGPGNAVAKLGFRADKLETSVLDQEVGHNFGFDHVNCATGESVMASPICGDLPTASQPRDVTNWNNGYWADAVSNYVLTGNSNGCLQFGVGSYIHPQRVAFRYLV